MADRKDVTANASDEKQTRDFLQSEGIVEKGTDQNPPLLYRSPPMLITMSTTPKYMQKVLPSISTD